MLTLENLAYLHRICRQLHSRSYEKVYRTHWKPVLSSAYPMCPFQLHPQFWQPDINSQVRLLTTKEVINSYFILVPKIFCHAFPAYEMKASFVGGGVSRE